MQALVYQSLTLKKLQQDYCQKYEWMSKKPTTRRKVATCTEVCRSLVPFGVWSDFQVNINLSSTIPNIYIFEIFPRSWNIYLSNNSGMVIKQLKFSIWKHCKPCHYTASNSSKKLSWNYCSESIPFVKVKLYSFHIDSILLKKQTKYDEENIIRHYQQDIFGLFQKRIRQKKLSSFFPFFSSLLW